MQSTLSQWRATTEFSKVLYLALRLFDTEVKILSVTAIEKDASGTMIMYIAFFKLAQYQIRFLVKKYSSPFFAVIDGAIQRRYT